MTPLSSGQIAARPAYVSLLKLSTPVSGRASSVIVAAADAQFLIQHCWAVLGAANVYRLCCRRSKIDGVVASCGY